MFSGDFMKVIIAGLAAAFLLVGCQSSTGSATLTALPQVVRADARVVTIALQNTPQGTSSAFEAVFAERVQSRLSDCAAGTRSLKLEVTLDGWSAANPALALFAPAQSQISGVARLLDDSGAVVGVYRIRRSFTMGGVGGMVMATGAETHMSNAFGEELCKQAFEKP